MRKKRKRKRMRLPSIDAIGIIMLNDWSSEYCLYTYKGDHVYDTESKTYKLLE